MFELWHALTVANKKSQCVAIMFIKTFQNCLVRLSRYLQRSLCRVTKIFRRKALPDLDGYEGPSVVERPACTGSLVAFLEAEGSVSDSGPTVSGNR